MARVSRVHVVRHAKAGKRDEWRGDDALRPLTAAGRAQAQGLVDVLAPEKVVAILSSPYTRCRETVEPLAAARGLPVEPTADLIEGVSLERVLRLAAHHPGAVLCTHGDIVTGIVDELNRLGVTLPAGRPWEKGSTWTIEVNGGRLTAGSYLSPP